MKLKKAPDRRQQLKEIQEEMTKQKRKFTVCWMIAMVQVLVGWMLLCRGINSYENSGAFLSFDLIVGINLLIFFTITFFIGKPVYNKLKKLTQEEKRIKEKIGEAS